jgi:phosphatidylinositol alpha-mannosyltransferase
MGLESVVLPAAVDVAAFRAAVRAPRPPRAVGDRLVVGFLGRLVERKGVLELLAALALLPGELLGALDVRIGGRGPLLEDAQKAVGEHGLGELVSFAGFVTEEDKPQFLADCDVAVFPALGGESFGIVLIEAMAAGAGVVLAGANPGYLAVIGDRTEVSVDAQDTSAFAAILERLLTDAALRAEIHAEQQALVETFDVNVVGERVMRELYIG